VAALNDVPVAWNSRARILSGIPPRAKNPGIEQEESACCLESAVVTTENELVDRLRHQFPARPPVTVGIGDDGAVLQTAGNGEIVVVTDMLLDGVHFDLRTTPPRWAGRKAVAVNLSDLAAMACRPTAAFVSLALPRSGREPVQFVDELYEGIRELADRYAFTVAGGDTNSWTGPFAINVCLTGEPVPGGPVLRSTARPGDAILVSGALGGSLASGRHLRFEPRLELARYLAGLFPIHAMMDVSDGLSTDLARLTAASGVGAVIDADCVPIHPDVPANLPPESRLGAALNDGEDFELLICAAENDVAAMIAAAAGCGCLLTRIGEIKFGSGCRIRGGDLHEQSLVSGGWQHTLDVVNRRMES
jgi:thiamine-monophosphate kinase